MILRSTETSPFGRKVRMALVALGLGGRVRLEPADTMAETDGLRLQNPLGKMPCLLIGKEAFFDSHVILEMLDALAGGGRLMPRDGLERFRVLTRARLADGITDAALLATYEDRFRTPDQTSERWLAHQKGKITRALAAFESDLPDPARAELVQITLAAALGYLNWRRPLEWRETHPELDRWLQDFARNHPCWTKTERTQE
ncbi:glutathione S-transferase [Phaeobacter sp. HF9A]|nr:glutathione S-transferase [Phaeobacter sp. HF9A]